MLKLHKKSAQTSDHLDLFEKIFIVLANIGIMLGCFTRMIAYSELFGSAKNSPGPNILSDDGELLWVYVILWGISGALATIDLIRGRLGYGLTTFLPLMAWWGFSYFLAWAYSNYQSYDWMSVGIYFASVICIGGLFGAYLVTRYKNGAMIKDNTDALTVLMEKEHSD